MKYSVIVPVFNHETGHLRKKSFEREDVEWIFVMTGKEKSANMKNAVILNASGAGYGRAVNLGVSSSKGDFLVILNDDVHLPDDFFDRIDGRSREVSVFEVYDFFSGKIESAGSIVNPLFYNILNKDIETEKDIEVTGSAFIIDRSSFEKAGGFDEDFGMYYEDADFSRRIKAEGVKVTIMKDMKVMHEHSSSGISSKRYFLQRNRILFAAKHIRFAPFALPPLVIFEAAVTILQVFQYRSLFPLKARLDAAGMAKRFYDKTH